MSYSISSRMQGIVPDAVACLFKTLGDPSIISFAGGSPSPDTFPIAELAEISREMWERDAKDFLRYGVAAGYEPLRQIVRKRFSEKFGLFGENDEVIITTGAQQCLDLAAKLLVNEGDTVLCDTPCFAGTIGSFLSYGAHLVGVPVDENGMDPDALERAVDENKNVRLIYTIPTFQNPSGVTMSLERRRRVCELAARRGIPILEDSPYFELRYSGEDIPHLKALDKSGNVMFSGTFSKILAPGLRLGYLIFDKSLYTDILNGKQGTDLHTPLYTQMLIARYFERCDVDAHIKRACDIYREQRDCMLAAMDRCFDRRVTYTRPDGGLFIYCTLPDGYPGAGLCELAAARGVCCIPGDAFDTDGKRGVPGFRLNYSLSSREKIEEGIEILGECLKEYLK